MISHTTVTLPHMPRGFHLITDIILDTISLPTRGILHLFIQHTSAGLMINENAEPAVRVDFESFFNHIVPEHMSFVTHTDEGPDDMPAHVKASMVGSSLSIPVINGSLSLGMWQGIYLCEFRNHASPRHIIASIYS